MVGSREVSPEFHPRKTNCRKTYEYRIRHDAFPMPTERLYTHWVHTALDVDKMREAAAYLVGEHDFKSFCSVHTQAETTIRTIYQLEVEETGAEIRIRVCGNGFLYNMVRIIVGTLVAIGRGQMDIACIAHVLETGNRELAGPTAPAQGLMLMQYEIME